MSSLVLTPELVKLWEDALRGYEVDELQDLVRLIHAELRRRRRST